MRVQNTFVQAAIMIVVAIAIAIVANGFASRQRKLVLPGYYPHALRVPPRVPERVPPPPITETAAMSTAAAASPVTATTTAAAAPVVPATTATVPDAPPTATTVRDATHPAATTTATATPAATAPAPPAADPLARFQPHPDKAFVEISGADAKLLHGRGVLFLDARRTSVFEDGHIAGARSFSVWESDIDDKVNALFGERSDPADQNLPIVIYCSGGDCEDSHMLAQKLWGIQFNNVYVYKDGYPDWQQRNGATRKGVQP